MSVSSTEHLDKLAFILYDRPAGRNVIGYAIEKIEQLRADNERLREALEIERLRLAAVDSVAMADTPESAIVARQILPDYRSAALTSVERRVNEVIALRAEIERLRAALRWYADQRNHFPVEHRRPGDPDPAVIFVEEPPIMSDGGKRARKALEGEP